MSTEETYAAIAADPKVKEYDRRIAILEARLAEAQKNRVHYILKKHWKKK